MTVKYISIVMVIPQQREGSLFMVSSPIIKILHYRGQDSHETCSSTPFLGRSQVAGSLERNLNQPSYSSKNSLT